MLSVGDARSQAPAPTQVVHGAATFDGPLRGKGLLVVHGPLVVSGSVTVKYGRELIHDFIREHRVKDVPPLGKAPLKEVDGAMTVHGPMTVRGDLLVDGLEVFGGVTTGGGWEYLGT